MAAKHVKADAIFSMHYERMSQFIAASMTAWQGHRPETHTASRNEPRKLEWIKHNGGLNCDYIWPDACGPGSSGWNAAKVAKMMGFDEVILCGIPIQPGPYHKQTFQSPWERKGGQAKQFADGFASETQWHPGCYSMSGFTREVLGAPPQRSM